MKVKYIIGIVVIAIAIGIIVTTSGDASTYVSFKEARAMASEGNDEKIHVVGKLPKNESGETQGIETDSTHLHFSFLLVDQNKEEQRVFYNEPMPMDFKKSEQIVVIGHYKKNIFIASKILLKCPSKYQDEKAKIN